MEIGYPFALVARNRSTSGTTFKEQKIIPNNVQNWPELRDAFEQGFASGDFSAAMTTLLTAVDAEAVGLWQCAGPDLVQRGFAATERMAEEVRRDFANATLRVPLARVDLGIVKSAVTRTPAIAWRDDPRDLTGSAGWLAKFGARQSVAFPVLSDDLVSGAMAVSCSAPLEPGDARWLIVEQLADFLAPRLARYNSQEPA